MRELRPLWVSEFQVVVDDSLIVDSEMVTVGSILDLGMVVVGLAVDSAVDSGVVVVLVTDSETSVTGSIVSSEMGLGRTAFSRESASSVSSVEVIAA